MIKNKLSTECQYDSESGLLVTTPAKREPVLHLIKRSNPVCRGRVLFFCESKDENDYMKFIIECFGFEVDKVSSISEFKKAGSDYKFIFIGGELLAHSKELCMKILKEKLQLQLDRGIQIKLITYSTEPLQLNIKKHTHWKFTVQTSDIIDLVMDEMLTYSSKAEVSRVEIARTPGKIIFEEVGI